ncbi:hypothetical protein DFR58_106101 [Anaerobacterium chartisolvens]|uniref:Uncharacterized protein n=1 Tax=Anaerobacterium chartisolvens TaxID=1297424 RepID=A0A369B8T1_9FIRM|nr:hypothetical protein [Anaerobacterium chartisolvens]RCX17933.1 hypothetical protein DFR58_106101 [Anaerobacterium chartisolvens]
MFINLFMVVFLSIPEFFLSIVLMLIISGNKERLKPDVENASKLIIAIGLMVVATCILRPLSSNVVVSVIVHAIAYVGALKAIYKMNANAAVLSVTLTLLYTFTLENTFMPFVITYLCEGITNFYASNITMFLSTLPIRAFQLLGIAMFYKHDVCFKTVLEDRKYSIIFTASSLLMVMAHTFFSYIYVADFNKFSFKLQMAYSVGLLIIMLSFYTAIFSFIYIMVKELLKGAAALGERHMRHTEVVLKKEKDKNYLELQSLCGILEGERNVDKAISFIKKHISENERDMETGGRE